MKNKTKKASFCTILISLLLLFSISSSEVKSYTVEEIFNTAFDTEVENRMERAHIPSCAISVINHTEVVFEKGYGDQPELNTVYFLASLNKPLEAVAFLHLYEEGIVDLDEDINTYLPYIIRNPYYPNVPITSKMLLSMCASINGQFNQTYIDVSFNHTIAYPDFIYELLNVNGSLYSTDIWRDIYPGTSSSYSTLSFDILTYILELQTNKTYEQYLDENVLTPPGMTNTKGNWSDYDPSQCAIPYY
ncbi:MAG: serine hydrolase domain-containing protein [Candidatus Heimdallarchaeaceae archaeon]